MKHIEKIDNLVKALKDLGIRAEVDYNAEWYCGDGTTHCGIEISTDMDDGNYDYWSFCFTPNGKYIDSCLDAPIKQ